MPRTCTVCTHPVRSEVDEALLAGEPFRNIAKRYGTSPTALFRHKQADIPATLAKAKQAADDVQAETLFDRLREINRETKAILEEARKAGFQNNELALKAIARAEKQLELEARLLGELNDAAKVAVGINVSPVTFVFSCERPPWAPAR